MCVVTFDWKQNDAEQKFRAFEKDRNLSWVVLEVTEICNLNCKWCFANSGTGEHMPLEKAKGIIDTLAGNNVRQVTISGGEPTLYPWLRELVAYAYGKGMVVHLNSNGFALTRELVRSLKEAGLSQVQINIDSMDPSKHDAVRGRKGSWGRAIEGLRHTVEEEMTAVSQTVLTRDNEGEVMDIFKLARSLGVQRCRVWDMTPAEGKALENKHLLPTDYLKTLNELGEYAKETGAVRAEAGEPFYIDAGTGLEHTVGFCVALHGMYMVIARNGDVFACATHRVPLYNISDVDSGLNGFHKEKLEGYINKHTLPKECDECERVSECKGGCVTRRLATGKGDYICKLCVLDD